MNRRQALAEARLALSHAAIKDTPLEGELLLRHALGISRVELYQDFDQAVAPEVTATFRQLVARRLRGEPSAYITGHREFYGLDFHVDRRVLIPRPESELLVEKAVSLAQHYPVTSIADIGTGSGALAICLALNLPRLKIYATDASADALAVARLNCRRHAVSGRVLILHGDMLDPLPEPVDIILANLPYVKKAELPPLTVFEPAAALDGGPEGLDGIRRLCRQLPGKLRPGGHLVIEIGYDQKEAVSCLLHGSFPGAAIDFTPDLGGIDRMVCLAPEPAAAE